MRKGIALAIDTTVVIILAVVVLVILISLLLLVSGPTQSEFQARLTQSQVCGNYRNVDTKCEGGSKYAQFVSDGNNENLLKNLNLACHTLRISQCTGTEDTAASESCIKACCPACSQSSDQNTPSAESDCKSPNFCIPSRECAKSATGKCSTGQTCCAETKI